MKTILLVNNQEAFLDRNKSLLNRAGFLILTAASANEALHVCREQTVALIIAGLDLPGTGGDQLCTLIRQESELKNVSIILVCYDSDAELARASSCGANAVVTKPIRPDVLLKQVEKFLGIQARREYRAEFNARVEGTRERLVFSGMTRNISASGILCETNTPLQQGELISNLFFSLNSSPIVSDGKVIWSAGMPEGKYSYGVRFLNLAPEHREVIEEFVASPSTTEPAANLPNPVPAIP
jgi:DNA-binding response OmpR family regulator